MYATCMHIHDWQNKCQLAKNAVYMYLLHFPSRLDLSFMAVNHSPQAFGMHLQVDRTNSPIHCYKDGSDVQDWPAGIKYTKNNCELMLFDQLRTCSMYEYLGLKLGNDHVFTITTATRCYSRY